MTLDHNPTFVTKANLIANMNENINDKTIKVLVENGKNHDVGEGFSGS